MQEESRAGGGQQKTSTKIQKLFNEMLESMESMVNCVRILAKIFLDGVYVSSSSLTLTFVDRSICKVLWLAKLTCLFGFCTHNDKASARYTHLDCTPTKRIQRLKTLMYLSSGVFSISSCLLVSFIVYPFCFCFLKLSFSSTTNSLILFNCFAFLSANIHFSYGCFFSRFLR